MDYFRIDRSRCAGTILPHRRDTRMATVTRAPGKSDFIKQVLGKNPQATFKAVNEAWTEAGNDGSISQALVNKMRSEAGLSGNLRTNGKAETPAVVETARPRQEAGSEAEGQGSGPGQDLVHQGVPQRPSRGERQGGERGMDESRVRRLDQRHACQQDAGATGLTGNRVQAGDDEGCFGDQALHRQEAGQEAEGVHRRGDSGHWSQLKPVVARVP